MTQSGTKKVIILTEGSKEIGFGHISRCIAIVQAFAEFDIQPHFLINGDDTVSSLLQEIQHETFNWLKNRKKLYELCMSSDAIIIDSYLAEKNFYKDLSRMTKLLVSLDDNHRINYPPGIVLNGAMNARVSDYPQDTNITYCVGGKYALLRKPFLTTPQHNIHNSIQSILITLGGTDIRNLTPSILSILQKEFPNTIKSAIVGGGNRSTAAIEEIADTHTILVSSQRADQMKQLMLESDIAISAAGQTLNELAATGTPTLAIIIASNQIKQLENRPEKDFLIKIGSYDDKDLLSKMLEGIISCSDRHVRERMSRAGQNAIDGQGSRRLAKLILNKIS